ncbi:hypothetical protein GCM10010326_07220 [Streptomyces xanthochromogenes]|uniref:Uncharacterized protein n=1 Tax=Streptomyces xanthochromogenes TaxID=67384 RepID=A0ABQ2ZIH3_9ACTN|nr:hypothetical protein GCM10010326_07220 [Streptomyces xanthochromogenes]
MQKRAAFELFTPGGERNLRCPRFGHLSTAAPGPERRGARPVEKAGRALGAACGAARPGTPFTARAPGREDRQ